MAKSGHFGAVFTQRALWTLRGAFLSSCSVLSDEIRCFKCKNNFLTGSDEKFCPFDNPTNSAPPPIASINRPYDINIVQALWFDAWILCLMLQTSRKNRFWKICKKFPGPTHTLHVMKRFQTTLHLIVVSNNNMRRSVAASQWCKDSKNEA